MEIKTAPIRILLIDDHEVVRGLLSRLLQVEVDCTIVGVAGNAAEGLRKAEELQPDVAVLDLNLPDMDGLHASQLLKIIAPSMEILIASAYGGGDIEKVFSFGARGYILKSDAAHELAFAIRSVHSKLRYVSAKLPDSIRKKFLG